ncbi:SDR family NAD(P)-dependent oxidoreductase [Dellaglioa sp. L3N]
MSQYKELRDLRNRIVLISGGSSGLGKEMAYEVARKGAVVIICARQMDKLLEVKETCQRLSGRLAYAMTCDVSDPLQIEQMVKKIESSIGPIDVLINNAGFGLMENVLTFDMDIAEKMFRVNLLGLMYMTQNVALHMADRKCGVIVNIASIASKIATPKSAVYSATKFGVLGYSNALRLELKPLGIKVMTVNPGPIATNFFKIADKKGDYLKNIGSIMLKPNNVAQIIVKNIGTNRREINLPYYMEIASLGYTLFPKVGDFLAGTIFNKK